MTSYHVPKMVVNFVVVFLEGFTGFSPEEIVRMRSKYYITYYILCGFICHCFTHIKGNLFPSEWFLAWFSI